MKKYTKVTLYFRGGFGWTRIEAKEFECERVASAQYRSAVRFKYKEPRKRKWRGGIQDHDPTLVVLKGWGHFSPDDWLTKPERSTTGLMVRSSRFTCFSPEYDVEFKEKFAEYLEANPSVEVLEDFRGVNTASGTEAA